MQASLTMQRAFAKRSSVFRRTDFERFALDPRLEHKLLERTLKTGPNTALDAASRPHERRRTAGRSAVEIGAAPLLQIAEIPRMLTSTAELPMSRRPRSPILGLLSKRSAAS